MKNDLTTGSVFRNVVSFSLPYLLSYFLQTLYGMADLFIIGQFEGVASTTAVSIGSQVMHIFTVMLVGLAMGATVSIAQATGGGDKKRTASAIGNTVTLFMLLSLALTALLLALRGGIVSIMSTPEEAVQGTLAYLTVCFIGIPFITAYNIIASIFRGLGDSKSPLYFIAVACVVNIALDYYFMGTLHLGPAGAALGLPLDEVDKQVYFVELDAALSPIACAYIRARGADRLCSYGDWAALSDECDAATAEYLKGEVSDGIIAPSFSEEALAILKTKKGGKYNIVQMDPTYIPAPQEQKDVFGVTFEQGRNNCKIDESLLANIVTENKNLPDDAKRDMIVSLITLKYTQSNSVCYAKDGQTIGVGAGQQSRIHCTRLAGSKADNWYLRRHPKVLALPFVDGIRRPDRDNAIDVYISDECDDVLADGAWQRVFKERPEPLTVQERKDWVARQSGVTVGSDAFFPFGDNVERARKSGVTYIAEPGGSIRDDNVIETANKYGITMAFTGQRLFHH